MYTKLPIMMMKKNDYTEITEDHPGGYGKGQDSVGASASAARDRRNRNRFWDAGSFFRSWSLMKVVMLAMVFLLLGIIFFQGIEEHNYEEQERIKEETMVDIRDSAFVFRKSHDVPLPAGVNIGSWLALEDYFFAGPHNSVEVATPGQLQDADKIAACLPPLHVGSTTGPKWYSETDLFRSLMDPSITPNGSVRHAVQVFAAHRTSFVDFETDLQRLKSLGIQSVRIPMNWCWTDHDPRHTRLEDYSDEKLLEMFACVDPFFDEGGDLNDDPILWPAIPKAFIEDFLRGCARAGIKASLDVHTYPGGTSIGTFSGVWPNWPRFWTHGGDGVPNENNDNHPKGFGIGHELFQELVSWMEDLSDRDPFAFSGLRGLSPMNEPAHLAGIFDPEDSNNFLPALPPNVASEYREELSNGLGEAFPDGTHLRVFLWFHKAIQIFRNSKLPGLGKELQANIHESIFHRLAPDWIEDENLEDVDESMKIEAIAKWWCASDENDTDDAFRTTAFEERSKWAVLDIHHYHAWSDTCSGTVDGQNAAYACGDRDRRSSVLDRCVQSAPIFRETVDRVCGTAKPTNSKSKTSSRRPAKLMSAEFSAASHHSVREACNDIGGLRESYTKQVEAGKSANVELFYWSYRMPYGGSFRRAWSFRQLMYELGVLDRPDIGLFECDAQLVFDPEVPN